MAKKLALIDPDLLISLLSGNKSNPLPPADPTLKQMNRLDNKITTVLSKDNTDPNAIVQQVNDLLTRYGAHHENYQKNPHENKIEPPTVEEKGNELERDIIKSLPKTLQQKGELLLQSMKKSNVSWDTQGRVTVNGKYMQNSNILDITHSLLRKRKKEPPPSLHEVYEELKKNNIPSELIPNQPSERVVFGSKSRPSERVQSKAKRRKVAESEKPWKLFTP